MYVNLYHVIYICTIRDRVFAYCLVVAYMKSQVCAQRLRTLSVRARWHPGLRARTLARQNFASR